MRAIKILINICLGISLVSCYNGSRVSNTALQTKSINDEVTFESRKILKKNSNGLLILSFSGGGTRAAALSYGVLKALRDSHYFDAEGIKRSVLDDVDIISSVSGGSFTSAYYGLFGNKIFEEFEKNFLHRNVQSELSGRLFNPLNWFKLMSKNYDRTSLTTEYYDEYLFQHKTFSDLYKQPGPEILINATELSTGTQVIFNKNLFLALCSEISEFKISHAVAASSAVPVVFTPITLENFNDCEIKYPEWWETYQNRNHLNVREKDLLRRINLLIDKENLIYLHLADGAIVDNLGIRSVYDSILIRGGIKKALKFAGLEKPEYLALIIVNAEKLADGSIGKSKNTPTITQVGSAVSSIQIQQSNVENISLLEQAFEQWSAELAEGDYKPKTYIIQLDHYNVTNENKRNIFLNAPTSLTLKNEDVDDIINVGQSLLKSSSEYNQLLKHFLN